ncbi:NADPH-dependent F420 reductase [Homoserinibacter sp. GY 40078]|uniref:NADPH-dependent F420 reductase n=1 Tax=Homoserinibacter sp. GY 40078 TaxID=2603275 RepID=UPI0011C76B55|nr:NAD(P)-binding domain-containing protein [Homoserinibacter sp. GY 40078]TXK17091.1 NADP oxidoreductase [Homoserinibacter sp. GY 40078]
MRNRWPSGNRVELRRVDPHMTTYGIIGAGHIGSQLARALTGLGEHVVIANSRGPETLGGLIDELGPLARAVTAAEAAEAGDVVIVTVPLRAYRDIPAAPLVGKVVLDTNNYYWERDGHIAELDRGEETVSGLLQRHLPGAKVAKAFNHIMAADITTTGSPAGTPGRRALATASDFPEAVQLVTELYDRIGFDTVSAGPLAESWRVERDRPAYVVRQDADELRENLAKGFRVRPEDAA